MQNPTVSSICLAAQRSYAATIIQSAFRSYSARAAVIRASFLQADEVALLYSRATFSEVSLNTHGL